MSGTCYPLGMFALPCHWQSSRWGASLRVCHFGCLKGVSKSVQVLLNGEESVMVLTLIFLKQRALSLNVCLQRAWRVGFYLRHVQHRQAGDTWSWFGRGELAAASDPLLVGKQHQASPNATDLTPVRQDPTCLHAPGSNPEEPPTLHPTPRKPL